MNSQMTNRQRYGRIQLIAAGLVIPMLVITFLEIPNSTTNFFLRLLMGAALVGWIALIVGIFLYLRRGRRT